MKLLKKKEKDKNISATRVRIEVFRQLGGKIPYTIAKFEALQEKDSDNNLVLIDSSNSFKDDVDIVQHKLISDLNERLALFKLSHEEQIKAVENKIKEQQTLIASIKDGYVIKKVTENNKEVEKGVMINRLDEDCTLREYQVLLDHLKNNGEGSYETIDSDGLKRIFYLYKEGIFYPYKWIESKHSLYADTTTRRKIYKETQNEIELDYLNDNKGFFSGWKKWLGIAVMIIWMISLIYWSINLNKAYATFDKEKETSAGTKCAYWCSGIVQETENFNNWLDYIEKEKEEKNKNTPVSVG